MVHHLHLCLPLRTAASARTHHGVPTAARAWALGGLTGLEEPEMQPLLPMISKGWKNKPKALVSA